MNSRTRWMVLRSVLFSIGFGLTTLLTPAAVEQLYARQTEVCSNRHQERANVGAAVQPTFGFGLWPLAITDGYSFTGFATLVSFQSHRLFLPVPR